MSTTHLPALGKVFLVGAGPGAVDLITLRGARLLAQADIVFHDALVDPTMLDLCPQATKVAVGKRCGKLSSAQHFINKRLVDAAKKHQIIIRLKGGDPMMFGRADEEIQALKLAGIEVEVVPGITAALAGAASMQQSLTLRGVSRSVAFVTVAQGQDLGGDISSKSEHAPLTQPNADTLVYYMGRKDATSIARQLIEGDTKHDDRTPAHILEAVSTKNERHWTSTLGQLANGVASEWFNADSPALIMIGEALRQKPQVLSSELDGSCSVLNDGLQNSFVLTSCRRSA
ncbi:MAG: uroporphyrinogen-III C-methyltransferase [Polynucleobacter sp. 24-46-87]|jgi:uroporphyrin-III C-methyltransferase|nr:MAG: uroporphyrinogen-III C-methyltransferase [Polynucleobacter sp. 32-46-5]OYY58842.1 MAG: uroporphyrinogen-III C-methyltransferase [Polynucleobacter sp. 35-46-207]OYZ37282.1 MAG: uroporphyrinogen-III C-methyltransferase [Polynucleobacter sp. 16-46-70]OZA13629.1 MAG: uroporphyrinogen-III C-methyltransferase [Polynucleobacter sp. 24-46-87]OZA41098.1 MAG: uroporphyrinogen-III C-methyltransferase [Polynucleobacter sp. 17-46-58]OZB48518.1 MAG: uroporphyrinogen-III C-methyltransferase [Polynucl